MLSKLFGRRRVPRQLVRNEPAAVEPIERRVLMIVHDPLLPTHGGRRLSRHVGWHDPETLAQQYIDDLRLASGGIANYTIVERHLVDDFPVKVDGFRYTRDEYLACWARRSGFHQPDAANYHAILTEFDVIGKVLRHEIDELWLFAGPYAGYYESHMAGTGAIWCNSPPLMGGASCGRRFVIMGFNYERDVGCMLENFGHRAESIMEHVYEGFPGEANLWRRFTRYDATHPGRAECGNVHFAPNSDQDYDWGNSRPVMCRADAWYNFPDLSAPPREMRARDWGGGDMRLHHLWWLDHLPRAPGTTNGILNNWWPYLLQPDQAL
ncbi:MAG: hypothetical protein AB4911_14795 [Oscillochloridaceae bacterium umkhey_bin13]